MSTTEEIKMLKASCHQLIYSFFRYGSQHENTGRYIIGICEAIKAMEEKKYYQTFDDGMRGFDQDHKIVRRPR